MSHQGAGRLHVVEGSMNKDQYLRVLRTRVRPQMAEWFPLGDGIFQQDKAPAHTAKQCLKYLEDEHIRVLDWPGNSPDLNVIENLWAIIKKRLQLDGGSQTPCELISNVIQAWHRDATLSHVLQSLVESMPRRIESVIKAKGGHTKY